MQNSRHSFDANGNTTSKTESTGSTSYTWDYENRLASATLPGSGGAVYLKYDPFGRRIHKSSSSGVNIYAYDGDNLVEETNSGGAAVARYSQGLNIDEPLAMLRGGAASYYEADGLGSVTSLTNSPGTPAQTYTYDSFGNTVATSGSLVNSFQYTGREFDTETSLYYYRARYYDPQAGKFVSEDPLRFLSGSNNFYPYTGNNPVSWRDPSGEIVWIPIIVGAGGGIVGAIGEGSKGYRCGDRGWKLAGDIGRGALSGAAGALTGLYVTVMTGNPFVGGAAGSVAGDVVNGGLGGGFSISNTATNAVVGGALGVVGDTVGGMIRVTGGQNFNPLQSPRTFGPRAIQLYAGEVTNHAVGFGKDAGSECGCN